MRRKRLILASLVLLGLAPGTLLRSAPEKHDRSSPVTVTPLAVAEQQIGMLTLEAGWVFASENDLFGGWSALVDLGGDRFLAMSDAGRAMVFSRPDRPAADSRLMLLPARDGTKKREQDIESLTRDPRSGALWAGFERVNTIARLDSALVEHAAVRPHEMQGWPDNSGPETLVRLSDGRFIVIAETATATARHEALLFPGDPTRGARPDRFLLEGRKGYRPSDGAVLPDGRLLIVMRGVELRWPMRFPVMLVLADPSAVAPGEVLETRELARIEPPLPSDNFEGVAITDEGGGRLAIWLISDDNFSRFHRTILLKLVWDLQRVRA